MFRRDTKIQCPEYLEFVRAKPCCACGRPAPSSPDHLIARGRGSAKQNDFTAIPLCIPCHSQRQIGTEKFQVRTGVHVWKEAFWCLTEFWLDEERRAGAIIVTGKI